MIQLAVLLTVLWVCMPWSASAWAQVESPQARVRVGGNLSAARLLDLVSERLSITLVYEPATLERVQLRLNADESLTDLELWALSNEVLVSNGFTTVRRGQDASMAVVRLQDAPLAARIETGLAPGPPAGFRRELVRAGNAEPERISAAVRPYLSEHGSVSVIDEETVLIGDLGVRLDALAEIIREADASRHLPTSRTVRLGHLDAVEAVRLAGTVRTSLEKIGAPATPGELIPLTGGRAVLIVAPEGALDTWESLLTSLDQVEPVQTRRYSSVQFSPAEVAALLERALESGPGDGIDAPYIVVDDLTDSLLVTATSEQHVRIEAILDRLSEASPRVRTPMRTYVIQNRNVVDVRTVLGDLLSAGVTGPAPATRRTVRPAAPQRSDRLGGGSRAPGSAADSVGAESGNAGEEGADPLILTVDEGTNTLIAIGPPAVLDQIDAILEIIDVRQSQVMLEVLLISLTDGQTKDLGVELAGLITKAGTQVALASLFGLSGVMPTDDAVSLGGGSGGTAVILDPGDFSAVVRALETVNEGRSLSIPRILINNNESGSFNSVVQAPFASTNASDTVATTSFGGTQDAGTTISIRPQIAEGDHLVLEYSVSLSSFTGESADPSLPPPRQQNNLSSVATIPDGYTIAVGGIELTTEADAVSKVPLLGNIPGVGALFRSRSASASRSRFYVFIRASVMRHQHFEDLKYYSEFEAAEARVDDGWPQVEPRVIR